jgi:hypothetical protein
MQRKALLILTLMLASSAVSCASRRIGPSAKVQCQNSLQYTPGYAKPGRGVWRSDYWTGWLDPDNIGECIFPARKPRG